MVDNEIATCVPIKLPKNNGNAKIRYYQTNKRTKRRGNEAKKYLKKIQTGAS